MELSQFQSLTLRLNSQQGRFNCCEYNKTNSGRSHMTLLADQILFNAVCVCVCLGLPVCQYVHRGVWEHWLQQGEHKREIMSKQSVCSVHIASCDIRRIICVRRPPPPQNVVEPLSGWAVCLGCAVALGSVSKDNEQPMTGRVYRRPFSPFRVAGG